VNSDDPVGLGGLASAEGGHHTIRSTTVSDPMPNEIKRVLAGAAGLSGRPGSERVLTPFIGPRCG
jgi:hypothetical protein